MFTVIVLDGLGDGMVRLSPVQVDPPSAVFAVVGAVHPDGTVIVACEPKANSPLAVKVKVKLLPVVPPVTLLGFTIIVPSPLPAPTVNVAEKLSAGLSCCVAVTVCGPGVPDGTENAHVP